MRLLILGVTGMLGSALHKVYATNPNLEVWGTLRDNDARRFFGSDAQPRLVDGMDVTDAGALAAILERLRPDVVLNAVGVVKQLATANDPLVVLPINAMFPHTLAKLTADAGARMIHFSSDCVFSGYRGSYVESDLSDADDLYGKSKYIGEVHDQPHVLTIRTSGIGHELRSRNGLVEWFLSQAGPIKGFSGAIFSGLPWVELASVIAGYVLPRPDLRGLYHVSASPISKLDLLRIISGVYRTDITIVPDAPVQIDRSLDSRRFASATGFTAPEWPELVARMHALRF